MLVTTLVPGTTCPTTGHALVNSDQAQGEYRGDQAQGEYRDDKDQGEYRGDHDQRGYKYIMVTDESFTISF